jgi:serine/threonine-protein kinase
VLVFLKRCLTRDPAQRVHDIADVRLALEGAFDVPVECGPTTSPAEVRQPPWRLIAVGIAVIAAGAAVLGVLLAPILSEDSPRSVVRLTATPPNGVLPTVTDPDVAVSADGDRIAYATAEQGTMALYLRSLDQVDAIRITGVTAARAPFFSPDGQSIGFFDGDGLKRVAASGGPPVNVTPVKGIGRGATWGADDSIIFSTSDVTGLLHVPAGGGEVRVLTQPKPGEDHLFPQVLPGGRAVLFTIVGRGQGSNAQIAILDLESGTETVLLSGGSHAQYAASGHLVYGAAGALRAVAFDLDTLTVRGRSVPVVERAVTKGTGAANFAMSRNGSLVYESGDVASGAERALVWVDRQGREEVITAAPKRSYVYPRISPDGTRVALDIRDQQNDIWVWDLTRPNLTRLTFDPGLNRGVAWTPDGKTILFSAERDGTESLFRQAADASGAPERLTSGQPDRSQIPNSVAANGARLVFSEPDAQPHDLYTLQLDSARKVSPLLNGSYDEHNGEVSPDGQWLAYTSDESGSAEIYVRPFPNVGDRRMKISTGGGTRPAWARNGRELFYLKVDGTMVAVPIDRDTGGRFSPGTPASLFQGAYFAAQSGRTYDVSPDGSRFLMIKSAASSTNSPTVQLVVVLNWFEELKRLVPTK